MLKGSQENQDYKGQEEIQGHQVYQDLLEALALLVNLEKEEHRDHQD